MIMLQRESRVDLSDRAAFEQHGRESVWPGSLQFGAQMLAFGTWAFGGPDDVVVTHTAYQDLAHWAVSQVDGDRPRADPAILPETKDLVQRTAARTALTRSSSTRLIEMDDTITRAQPFQRGPGQRTADTPANFGSGSMISERRLEIADGKQGDFLRLTSEIIWPWLESQGGRPLGLGRDLMGSSDELTTWFAFSSLQEWYRFARPQTAHAPAHVSEAFTARANLVRSQHGRLLVIGTDWGANEG